MPFRNIFLFSVSLLLLFETNRVKIKNKEVVYLKRENFDIKIFANRFSTLLAQSNENTHSLARKLDLSPATISRYTNAVMTPKLITLYAIADIFDVNPLWLMGFDVPKYETKENKKTPSPNITEDYTTFPVIGEVAAGYDCIALEDWEGETIDIPNNYLKGRSLDEFFVLKVKGDSMYPAYQEGDKVLVLKQSTLNYSGQVGVILYDDEYASLKKVEFKMGEDWLRMVPINPTHPVKKVSGEDLEHCRILGIPRLLIREIED